MTALLSHIPSDGFTTIRGVYRRITVPDPAAGAEWTYTLEGGAWFKFLLGSGLLTTAATVANRLPGVKITDGTKTLYQFLETTNLTASLALRGSYVGGVLSNTANVTALEFVVGVPGLWLPPGYTIGSATVALQAADQYSGVELLLAEADLGPYGERLGVQPELLSVPTHEVN